MISQRCYKFTFSIIAQKPGIYHGGQITVRVGACKQWVNKARDAYDTFPQSASFGGHGNGISICQRIYAIGERDNKCGKKYQKKHSIFLGKKPWQGLALCG